MQAAALEWAITRFSHNPIWAEKAGIALMSNQPGKLQQNAGIERFNFHQNFGSDSFRVRTILGFSRDLSVAFYD